MMNKKYQLLLAVVVCFIGMARAEVRLPKLIAEGMVIQRNTEVKIWGWADAKEKVEVSFKGKTYKTHANEEGDWEVVLKPSKAGGPYTLNVAASNQIEFKNILVGDVWLCNGQSNMVHAFDRYTTIYPEEIANSANDQIRQFLVPTSTNLVGPQKDLNGGEWKSANPDNLLKFSVVAYFMAKDIYAKYGIPIGIINASVGGTPIEAWMGEGAFKDFASIKETIDQNKDTAYVNDVNRRAAEVRREQFSDPPVDLGLAGDLKWYDLNYEPKNWKTMNIPGYWEDQGIKNMDGVVWFRREFDIPESMTNTDAFLEMGRIIDADEFYINGQKVGNVTYQYPPRRYTIPEGVLKPGKNVFVIRVTNNFGKGGFVPDKPYYLRVEDEQIDLKGNWQYKVGSVFDRRGMEFPRSISAQNQPTALYNAMVAPYTNFALKGVCWYQGESNSGQPKEYKELLPAYVNNLRKQFGQSNLPVVVIQLPNYMEVSYTPEESNWAEMRQAQADILGLENTGVVCTIDLGEWNDIHPMNKKPVGERAALVARHLVYGEELIYSGPMLKDAALSGTSLVLTFDHVGSGLISSNDEPLAHFAVAGKDEQYVWVPAKIEGQKVVLDASKVENPQWVRYAWADNPDFANLSNKEGLPAFPFIEKIVAQ